MPTTPACDKSAVCEAAGVVTNEEKVAMEPARDCLAVILRAGANDALLIPTGHAARPLHTIWRLAKVAESIGLFSGAESLGLIESFSI